MPKPGSWSQCVRKSEWRLSMNRPLVLLLVPVLVLDWPTRFRGRAPGRSGSWSQCAPDLLGLEASHELWTCRADILVCRFTRLPSRVCECHNLSSISMLRAESEQSCRVR